MNTAEQQQINQLRRDAIAADRALTAYVAACCPGEHKPIQHRDNRPPWCPTCRRTVTGKPIGR